MTFLYKVSTRNVLTCQSFLGLRMRKFCHLELWQIVQWRNPVILERVILSLWKAKKTKIEMKRGQVSLSPRHCQRKNKAQKNEQENVKAKSKKKNSSSAFNIGNLSSPDILQLREILGVSSVQNEGPSVFYLHGDDTYNLNVEVDNDGPYSDVEIVPSGAPAKPLNAQLRDALFSDDVQNKENARLVDDDIPWQLPKLKAPKKGGAISA